MREETESAMVQNTDDSPYRIRCDRSMVYCYLFLYIMAEPDGKYISA